MAISRNAKTAEEAQDARIVMAIRAFVTLQSDIWRAEQLNRLLPAVLTAVDEARNNGDAVDEAELIKQAWASIVQPSDLVLLS